MFDHHRKSPWFAEKYDPSPEFVKLRTRVRKVGWKGRIDDFLSDLEAGKFDPDITAVDAEAEPTSPIKENSTNGDATTNGGGPTGTTGEDGKDDEMQFNVEPEDETGDQDASRMDANGKALFDGKRSKPGEEMSVMPENNQVMIRTIPPDIGRVKLEDVRDLLSMMHLC